MKALIFFFGFGAAFTWCFILDHVTKDAKSTESAGNTPAKTVWYNEYVDRLNQAEKERWKALPPEKQMEETQAEALPAIHRIGPTLFNRFDLSIGITNNVEIGFREDGTVVWRRVK